MKRFVEGLDRGQSTLFPESLEDWVDEDNSVRVVDVFVDERDLSGLGFERVEPRNSDRGKGSAGPRQGGMRPGFVWGL